MNEGEVLRRLDECGLLLLQDRKLQNLVALVVGSEVSGSWWSHPDARRVYRVMEFVESQAGVLTVKLVSGKVTFVARSLWPALLAVATAGEAWQVSGLPAASADLIGRIEREGSAEATGVAVRTLEKRLLVRSEDVHTPSGAHATRMESWGSWADRVQCRPLASVQEAKRLLEAAVARINGSPRMLPWHSRG